MTVPSDCPSTKPQRRIDDGGGLRGILVDEEDGDLLLQQSNREDRVLQWVQALDMQVMGACRVDERLKSLLKLNASNDIERSLACSIKPGIAVFLECNVQDHQIDKAIKIFWEIPEIDSVSWTSMINGYVRVGKLDEAKQLLNRMPYKNIAAQTVIISGYVQNGRMDEASQIFNQIAIRDVVCWNTMIEGYAQCGRLVEALSLFRKMINKDIVFWNTMITGYAQVGQMDKAIEIFEDMGGRNIVSWNSLITGFVQNGFYMDALKSIVMMGKEGKRPDQSTFACGLSTCANLAALQVWKATSPFGCEECAI